jgi:hypothetical protein
VFCRYYIADANEYLVITGAGIEDIRIAKKAFVMPWQHVCKKKRKMKQKGKTKRREKERPMNVHSNVIVI